MVKNGGLAGGGLQKTKSFTLPPADLKFMPPVLEPLFKGMDDPGSKSLLEEAMKAANDARASERKLQRQSTRSDSIASGRY